MVICLKAFRCQYYNISSLLLQELVIHLCYHAEHCMALLRHIYVHINNKMMRRDWLQVVRRVALVCIFIPRVFRCTLLRSFSLAVCCRMSPT